MSSSKPRRFGLSWVQIIAAGFASITATVILSFFSISGTLIGAAVFSMASAIGNAVYGQSLRTTRDHVKDVVPFGKADPSSPTVTIEVVEAEPLAGEADGDASGSDEEPRQPTAPAGTLSRLAWKRVAGFAAATFVFVIAVVTSVELIAGRPLTDVVRGDHEGSGTSLFGGNTGRQIPTMTVTVTPSVVYTTPTVTQTAPAVTETATPTETPTDSGTPTASPSTPEQTGTATTSPATPDATSATRTSTRHAGR